MKKLRDLLKNCRILTVCLYFGGLKLLNSRSQKREHGRKYKLILRLSVERLGYCYLIKKRYFKSILDDLKEEKNRTCKNE